MRVHYHTDPAQLIVTALGVLVIIHAIRIAAVQMAEHKTTAWAAKPVAAFALVG